MNLFKSLFGGDGPAPETEKEKTDKKHFDILKYDGIRAQRMGKLPYAIKCFEEAVAINEEEETLALLVTAYMQADRPDDARITLDRLTEKNPENPGNFLTLANICYLQEDYESMDHACRKAMALDGKNPLAFYLTAKAAIGMQDEITAIAMLTKAITLKPDYAEAYRLRAEVLWAMQQPREAEDDVNQLLALDADDEQALLLKGEIRTANGEREEARACFKQVLSVNPFNEKAYLLSGESYLMEKDYDKAIAVYDEAVEINPNFAKAYLERGRAKLLKGDKEGSAEDMKKALELAPEQAEHISGQYQNYDNMMRNIPF